MIFGKYLGFHALPTEFHEMIDEKYLVSKNIYVDFTVPGLARFALTLRSKQLFGPEV